MRPIKKRVVPESSTAKPAPRQEIDRLIAKGWFKDAIKQAKLVHRAEPTSEHHRLLEQAYYLRARELREKAMPRAAQEVAMQLLDFGITDPELIEPAAALFLAVGLERQALDLQNQIGDPAALDRLQRLAADQAVLHPGRASATPEFRDGAQRVRSVLQAVTTATGSDSDPLDGLRDVSRHSPFADWRLFARGLVAFRRGDDADARANWDRLDADRAASRIARTLLGATDPRTGDGGSSRKLEALERRAFGEPILAPLHELNDLVGQGLWPEVVRKLTTVRLALRRFDPRLAVGLTEALYSLIIREAVELDVREGQNLLKGFIKAAEPLPIDPRWNRLWALAWESAEEHPDQAGTYWRPYCDDLATCQAIQPDERAMATALVLTHHGRSWADLAMSLVVDEFPGRSVDAEAEAIEARRRAISLYERSLTLFPSYRPSYQALMDAYEDGGQPEKRREVAQRLVEILPEDLDALKILAEDLLDRGEPVKALEFALRARKLKPLDPSLLYREWSCRFSMARQLALESRWDEARAELSAAAGLSPEWSGSTLFTARKACLEIKAGAIDAAKAILDEAVDRRVGPAPLWLAMAVEAQGFQLNTTEVDRYETKWEAAVKEKVRSESAGALAELLAGIEEGDVTDSRSEIHAKQMIAYFERTTRIPYRREDLVKVCSVISLKAGSTGLAEKLAKRGLKLFPEAAEFPMILATIEMIDGPYEADLAKVRKSLDSALQLAQAEAATNPKIAELLPKIKQLRTTIDDATAPPIGGGRMGGPFGSFMDEFAAMMDETSMDPDEMFDDDDEDDPRPTPTPTPTPSPRSRKNKKKKKR